jgi:hypothetical protein
MLSLTLLVLSSIVQVQGNGLRLEFDRQMHSRVVATLGGEKTLGPFAESESLRTSAGMPWVRAIASL